MEIKKGELPRLECFHNGIILIVICFQNKDIIYFEIPDTGNRIELKKFGFKFEYATESRNVLGLKNLNQILLNI